MKFKNLTPIEENELYKEMQNNPNVHGTHIKVRSGELTEAKKEEAAGAILSMMCIYGYYDKAQMEMRDSSIVEKVKFMLDCASKNIGEERDDIHGL